MDVSMWKQLMCRLYKGIDERVILLSSHAGLVKAKVQFVVQQFFALPIESTTMSELLERFTNVGTAVQYHRKCS